MFAAGEPPLEITESLHRLKNPPFRHLVADKNGIVLQAAGEFVVGDKLSREQMKTCLPIYVNESVVYAKSIGDANITAEDRVYLEAVKEALINGASLSLICSLVLGLSFGNSLSRTLNTLTRAIRKLKESSEEVHHVSVSSNDELGELAESFNEMNMELACAHRQLRELSTKDPLTNLYNRRYFNEQAKNQLEQSARYAQPLSIMIGDLDHFKLINDMYSP